MDVSWGGAWPMKAFRRIPAAVRAALLGRPKERAQFAALYGDFRFEEDYRRLEISGLPKESGCIRGEIVKAIRDIPASPSRILLPGENNGVKPAYALLFRVPDERVVTAGLSADVDHRWDFEDDPPAFGAFDAIVSQAMLEHLIQPFKHVRDLAGALSAGGHLILHTVMPGFPYHRYPIDCVRFFPDWFEETAARLRLEVRGRYIGDGRIMYTLKKAD